MTRADRLHKRQAEIQSLSDVGYLVKELNDGYCYRINGIYDLYPVNNKWHHLPSGKRGEAPHLARFLIASLRVEENREPKKDDIPTTTKNPNPMILPHSVLEDRDVLSGKICWYCGKPTQLVSSETVYDKYYGMIYLCAPCDAWVGVHENTTIGKGRVADADLRQWKKDAHHVFDKIWKRKMTVEGCSKKRARDYAYRWLSKQMGLPYGECHIGWMVIEECQRVIEICKNVNLEEVLKGDWEKE